jgi:hypothetical protein
MQVPCREVDRIYGLYWGTSSTRRFRALPLRVAFDPIGSCSPSASGINRWRAIPRLIK